MEPHDAAPRFSIVTPTYNGEPYLHRAFESVVALRRRDFEWLLIDDASTDGTRDLVRRYAAELGPRVRVAFKETNAGLLDTYRMSIAMARGEFFVGAAQDDRFDAGSLDAVEDTWASIPAADRPATAAITFLCRDAQGQSAPLFPRDGMRSNALEMYFGHRYRAEAWSIYRMSVLREFPFPPGRRSGEGVHVWFPMAERYQSVYRNLALRTYYRDNPRSLTNAPRLLLHADDLAAQNREMLRFALRYPASALGEAHACAARYLRFSHLAGRGLRQALADLPAGQRAFAALAVPLAALMLARDRVRGA